MSETKPPATEEHVLILRTCSRDMKCCSGASAKWLVIRALKSETVESQGKVRFRRGEIIYCGAMPGAYALVNAELLARIQTAAKTASGAHADQEEQHAAATGDYGHAAATGDYGHAAATGYSGTAFVGFNGKAKASAKGAFAIAWFDSKAERARLIVGTPGENGIKPDVWYRVNEKGQLVETEE